MLQVEITQYTTPNGFVFLEFKETRGLEVETYHIPRDWVVVRVDDTRIRFFDRDFSTFKTYLLSEIIVPDPLSPTFLDTLLELAASPVDNGGGCTVSAVTRSVFINDGVPVFRAVNDDTTKHMFTIRPKVGNNVRLQRLTLGGVVRERDANRGIIITVGTNITPAVALTYADVPGSTSLEY